MQVSHARMAEANAAGDAKFLATLPEIGKRTAESTIVELKGKLDSFLADPTAARRAAQASVPAAESFATIDTNFAFLSPARGRLVGEGRVVKAGRSIVFCEGECRDETGELVARGSGVFTVLRANPAQTADDRPGALSGQPS